MSRFLSIKTYDTLWQYRPPLSLFYPNFLPYLIKDPCPDGVGVEYLDLGVSPTNTVFLRIPSINYKDSVKQTETVRVGSDQVRGTLPDLSPWVVSNS